MRAEASELLALKNIIAHTLSSYFCFQEVEHHLYIHFSKYQIFFWLAKTRTIRLRNKQNILGRENKDETCPHIYIYLKSMPCFATHELQGALQHRTCVPEGRIFHPFLVFMKHRNIQQFCVLHSPNTQILKTEAKSNSESLINKSSELAQIHPNWILSRKVH